MLIAAVLTIWFLFGGSSGGGLLLFGGMTPHEMHEAVAAIEPDKSKREAIDQTLETIQKETKQLSSDQSKLIDDAFALMKRHDTTAEEFQAFGARAEALNMSSARPCSICALSCGASSPMINGTSFSPPRPPNRSERESSRKVTARPGLLDLNPDSLQLLTLIAKSPQERILDTWLEL